MSVAENTVGRNESGRPADPDAPLVARIAAGDGSAARELVGRHGRKLGAVAYRMLGSRADAEDVVQEAFMRVWTHAERWEPGQAKFETWLHRVTINLCYDRLRRRREVTVDELPERVDPAQSAEGGMVEAETAARVREAVSALPDRQRAAIVLCHFEGRSNIEAAELLEVSVDALESLLARGRRRLRQELSALMGASA